MYSTDLEKGKKVKNIVLDFKVPAVGADFHFMALSHELQKEGMGVGHPVLSLALPVYLPYIF